MITLEQAYKQRAWLERESKAVAEAITTAENTPEQPVDTSGGYGTSIILQLPGSASDISIPPDIALPILRDTQERREQELFALNERIAAAEQAFGNQ